MQKMISQDFIKKLFYYDKKTGNFIRNIRRGAKMPGVIAGSLSKDTGYRHIGIDDVNYKSSRLAFLYVEGFLPEHDVDHINRVRHDDRWCNLRHSTRQCNIRNQGMLCTNTSGIKGVWFDKSRKKWSADIIVDGVKLHLGRYSNKCNAIIARWVAEKKHGFQNCISSSSSYRYLIENNMLPNNADNLSFVTDRAKATLSNNTSGTPGVILRKGSGHWMAQIGHNRKKYYLGDFINKDDAVKARSAAEISFNFSGCKTTSLAYLYLEEKGLV